MAIESDNKAIRPIHYLGSKLRMLEAIKSAIDYVDKTDGLICDLFSGSGVVSEYLIQFRDVVSVDIQNYSSILSEASIKKINTRINATDIIKSIQRSGVSARLFYSFSKLLEHEQTSMALAQNGDLSALYEIIENGSLFIFMNDPIDSISGELSQCLEECVNTLNFEGLANSECTMITRYYGGLYFSYRQAVELDAIASFVFSQEGLLKTKLLAALLSTASALVNTVGKQFAQPLKVKNARGEIKRSLSEKIIRDRSIDTFSVFNNWLDYYLNTGTCEHNLTTLCMDYRDALEGLFNKQVKVVYADPPYTRYHYSRYYHVLETICLRDNPVITTTFPNGKGGISRAIYREGRHQSPFCIKSQAEHAFEQMFVGVKKLDVPLVLSYSPFDAAKAATPRLRSIDQLVEMAKKHYEHVEIHSPGLFTHSKLNSTDKNFESNHEAELLIICF